MKLFMMSSNALNSSAGTDCSGFFLFAILKVGLGVWVVVLGGVGVVFTVWVWVWGFSSVLTDDILSGGIEVKGGLVVIMMGFGTMVIGKSRYWRRSFAKAMYFCIMKEWGNCDLCEN